MVVEQPGYLRLLVDEAPLPRYDEVLRDATARATSAVEREERQAEHELALQLRELVERLRARHEQQRALVECAKELADVRVDPDRVLTISLESSEPGTTATLPDSAGLKTDSWRSRRSPALSMLASGP